MLPGSFLVPSCQCSCALPDSHACQHYGSHFDSYLAADTGHFSAICEHRLCNPAVPNCAGRGSVARQGADTAAAIAAAAASSTQHAARRAPPLLPGGGGVLAPAAGSAAVLVPAGMLSKYALQASGTLVLPKGSAWATGGQLSVLPALAGQSMGLSRVLKHVRTATMLLQGKNEGRGSFMWGPGSFKGPQGPR